MAITVRGTSTGASANATSGSISLPAGVAVGDVSIIAYQQASTIGTPPTITPPAGWTPILNGNGALLCWRAFQAGDATTGIAATSTLSNWWESLCITYTGLDTASPIDAQLSNFTYADGGTNSTIPGQCRAPSLCPNWMGSQLLCLYTYNTSGAHAISLPSGLTARVTTAVGPNLRLCDKALTDGTPTGTFDAVVTGGGRAQYFLGMQIALKAAGAAAATLAAARPEVAGTYNVDNSVASLTLPLANLQVQNGDMVVLALAGPVVVSGAPAGYTLRSSQAGAVLYTHLWQTGDTQAPVFTFSATNFACAAVSVVRAAGVSASPIAVDQVAVATNTGAGAATTTIATQTPANASELLLVALGTVVSSGGTWSAVTAGLTDEVVNVVGPGLRWSWASPAAVPTGTFGATWTASGSPTLGGAALLLGIAAAAAAQTQARAVVMA